MPQVLFKKSSKSKKSREQQQMDHDDIWDDSLLIKAYEESVQLRKEDVAKQLAMKTNKRTTISTSDENDTESSISNNTTENFKEGDYVRSTFADDGTDYEAQISTIFPNGTCDIRYLGYGNEERVKLDELIASWGPEAREEQITLAENHSRESQQTSESVDANKTENFHNFIMNKSNPTFNSMPTPPMPPMPPGMFDNSKDSEYLSAMLMSWYMSGYYTGLFQGRKQARDEAQSTSSRNLNQGSPSKKKKTRKSQNKF